MLKEAIPSTSKAAFLGMREGWEGSSGQVLWDAGGRLGIKTKTNSSDLQRRWRVRQQISRRL